jgi:hypothetical protein
MTAVVSEEDESLWARRQQRLDFGPNVYFCWPLGRPPSLLRWVRFLDYLGALKEERPLDLLIIDPVASFLPAGENHARALVKSPEELRALTRAQGGVLLLHHQRRAASRRGHATPLAPRRWPLSRDAARTLDRRDPAGAG